MEWVWMRVCMWMRGWTALNRTVQLLMTEKNVSDSGRNGKGKGMGETARTMENARARVTECVTAMSVGESRTAWGDEGAIDGKGERTPTPSAAVDSEAITPTC